jgi:hypothetical protein
MNERIKLPAQEWLGYDPERGDIHGYTSEQMRKFAELIVKECYESCRSQVLDKETADTNELTYNDAVGDCAIGLLQHFGMME